MDLFCFLTTLCPNLVIYEDETVLFISEKVINSQRVTGENKIFMLSFQVLKLRGLESLIKNLFKF